MTKRRRPPEGKGVGGCRSLGRLGPLPVGAFVRAPKKIDTPPFPKAEKAHVMTVDEAIASLNSAYDRMTAAEIREHALQLAACLFHVDDALASVSDLASSVISTQESQTAVSKDIVVLLRRAASCIVSGNQFHANRIVLSMSANLGSIIEMQTGSELPDHVPLLDAWPDVFAPGGSKNGC